MKSAIRRVVGMPPGELRFRLECELRKAAGRVRTATVTPRWNRAHLLTSFADAEPASPAWSAARAALSRRDYLGAHRALASHFRERTSAFPLNAAELPQLVDAIAHHFPDAPKDATRGALAICEGRYDLLGFKGLEIGAAPNWHRDPVNHRESPLIFWASVPYLDPATGDHKIIWELNRHQHWLRLGRAYALSGDVRFYHHFTLQLASWLRTNPPLAGINWASMLELAFRAISWLWALEFFAGVAAEDDREPWLVDMLLALDRQLTHVERNLSHYFSPNTHLSGEALALYVAGLALPELRRSARRASLGRDVLVREAARQVRSDGGHAELSLHYQRYSTDFYLFATRVARRAGDPAARVFEGAARRQVRFLRGMVDDGGVRPLIGDDDGGQLLPLCGRDAADCRDTFGTAAVLLNEPSIAIGRIPEETYWLCGPAAANGNGSNASYWPSEAFRASGYYVSRTARGDQLIFDAGPHGYLNGGHAHSDALSCVLTNCGRPVLIDPGTATYTMDHHLRDQFRGTTMHNTVVLDGRPQSIPRGAFHWSTMAQAQAPIWRSSSTCDYVEGTHDGYAPRRHTRAILAIHGLGWWILDHVLGTGSATVECYWHFHPSWDVVVEQDHLATLHRGETTLALASTASLVLLPAGEHPLAVWSPVYGAIEPAPVVIGRWSGPLPTTLATFIPATTELSTELSVKPVTVVRQPGQDWRGLAFRLHWARGAMDMLAAIEESGLANAETAAPVDLWGTAELRTDARIATYVERATGGPEAIVVNGTTISRPTDSCISLSSRAGLLRVSPATLAPTVHPVDAGSWR